MLYDENWAVETGRISAVFLQQTDVVRTENGFRYGNCLITLEPLPASGPGCFAVSRTRVRMEGPEEETNEIHSRFFLRFLSAGG